MRRIAVDWDGTLVTEEWPEMGEWLPGAVDALKRLAEVYDEVVIFTCRVAPFETDEETPRDNGDQVFAICAMLEKAGIPRNVIVWTRPFKPPAEFYVDDKAVPFHGDWKETLNRISFLSPNYAMQLGRDEAHYESFVDLENPDPNMNRVGIWQYPASGGVRCFPSGATRDSEDGKLDYEGFLSPLALEAYAQYMHMHRKQSDGTLRSSDNWQKGIPSDVYMKSMWRHFMEVWQHHRAGAKNEMALEFALCAVLFNAFGYLHELLRSDPTSGTLQE